MKSRAGGTYRDSEPLGTPAHSFALHVSGVVRRVESRRVHWSKKLVR